MKAETTHGWFPVSASTDNAWITDSDKLDGTVAPSNEYPLPGEAYAPLQTIDAKESDDGRAED